MEQDPSINSGGASDSDEDIPIILLQRFMTRIGENTTVKAIANDQYTFNYAGVWEHQLPKMNLLIQLSLLI